ncbi:integrase catalytic domain-containing protein [Trichonephila clavipes]|nr:integrase catalytic domain-containing protein [Trichonephila clavipes]
MQNYLDTLENWLTDWRIAINVEKSQAIVFRKWGVIDPQTEFTLFENNIQWTPVVRYLGLHIDSRLTFKKHTDYLSDKFWGRIALAISLIGRSSSLSLENKVILYKQTLRPILTYKSSVWAAAAPTHRKRIQVIQNKILRIITNAPCGPSPLPPDRVTDCAIFEVVGMDLAGPLFLKTGEKVWITLFTCAVYRALHLELVSALSSDAFLRALRRFIARRGRPRIIHCDNGTNFRGAFNDLAKLDWHKISRETSTQKIVWKFIPPTAAWWGGWWESRHLTYISENPQELIPLTPVMFLIENRCSDTTDFDELNSRDLRKRMKYRIKLLSDLRQRFRKEYLTKIIELIPGRDGEIRTIRLKTQHGTVIRPVQRIFPLEVQAIANSDKELKEESISVKSTKPEKILNTNDAIGSTNRANFYSLYPSGTNVNDLEMANLPTDMELELADIQRNSTRTPLPQPQLTPCEQLKYNKAQLAKMETFRRCKQACVDALMMTSDHHPEEPFYVRALTELQDIKETMALAVSDIDSFEPCIIPDCPHHEKTPQNSPLKMTQSTPKINPNINYSGKRKENSNFEYPPQRKTARKVIYDITDNEELNLSPNKFELPPARRSIK